MRSIRRPTPRDSRQARDAGPERSFAGLRASSGVLVALAVIEALLLVLAGAGPLHAAVANALVPGTGVAAAVLCVARVVRVREERAAWAALAAGAALFATSYLYWTVFVRGQRPVPDVAPSDIGELCFYPLTYLGLGLLVRSRVARFEPSMWLDGIVAVLTIGSVGCAVILPSVTVSFGALHHHPLATLVNLAYPLADLTLICLLAAALCFAGWRPGRVWLVLIGGFALIAAADSAYLAEIAAGSYRAGTLLDLLWPGGLVLVACSACAGRSAPPPARVESWRTLALPALLSVAAVGVLVAGHFTAVSDVAVVVAALALLVVTARTLFTYAEIRRLTHARLLALTDELTGLGNRRMFQVTLRRRVRQAQREGQPFAVLMLDLDFFKEVNDTLGYESGDAVLEQVSRRVESIVPPGCATARLGGDQFAIVMALGSSAADAMEVAERLVVTMRRSFDAKGLSLRLGASVGVVAFPAHADTAQLLVQRADVAMAQAKELRDASVLYDPARDSTSRERLLLGQDLRQAIEQGQLEVHYQPQIDLRADAVVGAEALVRWRHPVRGLVSPGEFLPLAERMHLSRAITCVVVGQVCEQLATWRASGLEARVSVNMTGADLLDERLAEKLTEQLAGHGLSPSCLTLEVTEDVAMGVRSFEDTLQRLHDSGFELSLDDFGTGHSSLHRLHVLPLSEVKVDRSFVARLQTDPIADGIVRSIVDLGTNLGLRVVAEGPEDPDTISLLRGLGCHWAQGFFYSPALPAERFEQWVATFAARDAAGDPV